METRNGPVYDSCEVAWVVGEYGPSLPACSGQAYRERSVRCQMVVPDGINVDGGGCASPKPETREGPVADWTGCTGSWNERWRPITECSAGELTEEVVVTCSSAGRCNPNTEPKAGRTRTASCQSSCDALAPHGYAQSYPSGAYIKTISAPLTGATLEERLRQAQLACEAATPSDARYAYKVYCGYVDSTNPAARKAQTIFAKTAIGTTLIGFINLDDSYAATCR